MLNGLNGSEKASNEKNDIDRIFRGPDTICGSCRILSKVVMGYSRLGGPIDIMANFLIKICYIVVYKSMPVCKGIINSEKVSKYKIDGLNKYENSVGALGRRTLI